MKLFLRWRKYMKTDNIACQTREDKERENKRAWCIFFNILGEGKVHTLSCLGDLFLQLELKLSRMVLAQKLKKIESFTRNSNARFFYEWMSKYVTHMVNFLFPTREL